MISTTRLLPALMVGLSAGLFAAGTAQAANTDALLKTATIASTLGTWGVAAWNGAPLGRCLTEDGPWGGRVQGGVDKELSFVSVGAVRRECKLTQVSGLQLSMAPLVSVGRWSSDRDVSGKRSAFDIALVPLMRWSLPVAADTRVDAEVGIGPAWLSAPEIGNRRKSTNFQFSDHLGLGLGSADGHWRVGLSYRHISNADIAKPNNAVDFKGLSVEWRP